MKTTLLFCFTLFFVAIAGIVVWYLAQVQEAEASRLTQEQLAARLTPVPAVVTVNVPAETPTDQPLFLAGTGAFGAWDAAGVPMQRMDDGTFEAKVEVLRGVDYEFKVTRGTWGTVERGLEGVEMPNHRLYVDPEEAGPVQTSVQVATWVDQGKSVPSRITYTGDVRLHKSMHSEKLGNERDIVVYLPPDYDVSTDRRYPVLYMQDGQNLFDESTSFAGIEWGVDETVEQLIASGRIPPIIVVGVYNSEQRTQEFTPGDRGAEYGAFFVGQVKPFIDRTYRTLPDRPHTALVGSGLGAVITLDMARRHPDTFAHIGVLSPWHWDGKPEMLAGWDDDSAWLKNTRFWVDAPDLAQRLAAAGLQEGTDYMLVPEVAESEHNETYWAQRVGDTITFLFGSK